MNDNVMQKYTGKERDQEGPGLDYFGARYMSSAQGRFTSPDPLGGDLTNPQSLNRYSYVLNNPLTSTDPTGMYTCADSNDCSSKKDQALEKTLAALRNSKDADVARAANAYGAQNKDNGVSVEGIDVPGCATAFLLASARSPRQFIQRRGRILRQAPCKSRAYIHDFLVYNPFPVTPEMAEAERKLMDAELARVDEFANTALNPYDAERAIADIPRHRT